MLHGVEREQFADVLQNFGDDRWEELVELLASAGSFDYANQLIENHVDRALQHLNKIDSNSSTELMADVAKRSRTRKV